MVNMKGQKEWGNSLLVFFLFSILNLFHNGSWKCYHTSNITVRQRSCVMLNAVHLVDETHRSNFAEVGN